MPKNKGYNAKYCSEKCKDKSYSQRCKPSYNKVSRKRSYLKIKNNPERYSAHLASCNKSAKVVRKWLAEYKVKRGCVDCGYVEKSLL
jgi:hypothetical protein